jgi:LysM domain-containing protein
MAKFVAATTGALLIFVGALATLAADVEVKDRAPERYTVQKGDTLWGIAGRFLKDPWRWPDIWRMNREQIKNPHWIYPGDVIVLDRSDGQWRLSVERPVTRLSPTIRVSPLDVQAIPAIPAADIEPYLSRPLITGPEGLVRAAQIVAGRDQRTVRGQGDFVYAIDVEPNAGDSWEIYRPGRELRSADGQELLGVEQRFLGTAKVERFAQVSTLRIASANEEIVVGDRLIPAPRAQLISYAPHAPTRPIDGQIIATTRDSVEVSRGWIVTLDKGARDQLDVGAVLAIYRVVPPLPDPRPTTEPDRIAFAGDTTHFFQPERYLDIPDERSGLLFVFRVFDRVAYAIVLNTTDPVHVGDYVRNP